MPVKESSRPARGKSLALLRYLVDPAASRKINDVAAALDCHRAYASYLFRQLHHRKPVHRDWFRAELTQAGRELIG